MDATEWAGSDRAGLRGYYLRELAAAADTAVGALDRVARYARHLAAEPDPTPTTDTDTATGDTDTATGDTATGDTASTDTASADIADRGSGGPVAAVDTPDRPDQPTQRPVDPPPADRREPVAPVLEPVTTATAVLDPAPAPRPAPEPAAPPPGGAHRADGTGSRGRPPRPQPDPTDPTTVEVPAWPARPDRVRRTVGPGAGPGPIRPPRIPGGAPSGTIRGNTFGDQPTNPGIRVDAAHRTGPAPGPVRTPGAETPATTAEHPRLWDQIRWYLGMTSDDQR